MEEGVGGTEQCKIVSQESFWIVVSGVHLNFPCSTISQIGFHRQTCMGFYSDCRDQLRMNLPTALFVLSVFGT